MQLRGEINSSLIIFGNFSTQVNRTTRQKINKNIEENQCKKT